MTSLDLKHKILKFWFDDIKPMQWFQKDEKFDEEIRNTFENYYLQAVENKHDNLMDDAKGCLALIILLDQFSRNMYRENDKMFASDEKALLIANHVQNNGFDKGLNTNEKSFMYLPFEHSENISDQEISVKLFEAMKDDNQMSYDYALRHYDVIKKFGRFPHRNKILNRVNTPEEEEYLLDPNSGF